MSTRIRHTVCTHVPRRSPAPAVKKMVRSTAMTPALAMRPLRSAEAGAGAAGWALGSQLCSGNRPALAPKPKIMQNTAASVSVIVPPAAKDSESQWKYSTTTPNSATNAPPTE